MVNVTNNNLVPTQVELLQFAQDVNLFTTINNNMNQQVSRYGRNVQNLEHTNTRYIDAQNEYHQIGNYEAWRYDLSKSKEQAILNDMNKPYQPKRFWRCGNLFFYRPNIFGDLIIGTKEEMRMLI